MKSISPDSSSLMSRRIRRILFICNNYDSFAIDEDGHIENQIAEEYSELSISNPPAIVRAESTMEALELIKEGEVPDIVLTMYNVGDLDVFSFAKQLKQINSNIPVVLLASFSREIYKQIEKNDTSCIDYFFCWNNSTDLIVAIIKLVEDKWNADYDILESGVRAILLVEDSVRYYSTYLPLLYKLILQQNKAALHDALNEEQRSLRKRARPKILMATCYDEAFSLYEKYRDNLLGVISDVGFVLHKNDSADMEKTDAGIELCKMIREDNPMMPILMQSSQESMREVADNLGLGFIVKKSKALTHEVSDYISKEFRFGDFVVTDPDTGEEIGRARNLYEFEKLVSSLTDQMIKDLSSENALSKWLYARGLFSLGNIVRGLKSRTGENIPQNRRIILEAVHDYRINQGLGSVAQFDYINYNDTIRFARVGKGSMGGKARGLAFLNHILNKYKLYDKWSDVRVLVPRTLVICTEYFDTFIKENGLQYVINADISDAEILSEFVSSTLPQELTAALRVFLHYSKTPIAVRSSSKLEDSYYQPFAGVYSTYMIPRTENIDQQLRLLSKAIKSVYASVYFSSSRGYISATANVISEEKMAIVLQEVCGSQEGGYYFPTLSGVARSLNFYPLGYEKAEEGIVKLAYGLGKAVVDGEQVLRFSPQHPKNVVQTSTPELTMRDTQKVMYALNLQPEKFKTSIDDGVNLERISIGDCNGFSSLRRVASTWDFENQRIVDTTLARGPKYVTFAHVLQYNTFPLADILKEVMTIAKEEMKCPIEIEFAADLERTARNKKAVFNVLQVRPIAVDGRDYSVNWKEIDQSGAFIKSESALGTGWIKDVKDILYLKPESFDVLRTREIAEEISLINKQMKEEGRNYVLIGYGRWGSSIPSLGVPVQWGDISEAKVLIECCLKDFIVDPSQGTHFFQNMTSFNVGYINVNPYSRPAECFDIRQLDHLEAREESEFFRLVSLPEALQICIDGRAGKAMLKIADLL